MANETETALTALFDLLTAYFANNAKWTGATVLVTRNEVLPQELPAGGWININDGDPGEPDRMLGGSGEVDYAHRVELDIATESADRATRDSRYAALTAGIGAALREDTTLGGSIHGYLTGQPRPTGENIEGAADLKHCVMEIEMHYSATSDI